MPPDNVLSEAIPEQTSTSNRLSSAGVMDRTVTNLVRRSMCLTQCRPVPKDLSAVKIRSSFLEYFCENNKHLHIRSCPVFSLRDPTLAFINAGMNQFKNIFLGLQHPPSPRVANSQKCIRVGGKHNDLDLVGEDGHHHTFFEMLGNWSFGDYFKKEACSMAWEMLTKVYRIPPERLYVTYFGGEDSLGLGPDFEVREIWREIGVKENHILPFGMKENFWEGGVTGPCGPCTEIHYDHCPGRTDAGKIVNSGSSDLTELWNLVFTQYNRKPDGKLEKLKTRFVDTGMGFERLVAVLQGKTSNYDTDLFMPLFEAIHKYTGREEYKGKYDGNAVDVGYRILADHGRMISVALSDGVLPSASAKLKRTLRKAFFVSEKIFGTDAGLLKELTNHVAESLSDAYPEIGRNLNKIRYIIEVEENILKSQRKSASAQWEKVSKTFPSLKSMNVSETPQLLEGLEYVKKNILDKGKLFVSGEDTWFLLNSLGVPTHVSQALALNLGLKFNVDDFEKYESSLKTAAKEVMHNKFVEIKSEGSYLNILTELERMEEEATFDYFKHDYRIDSEGKYIFKTQPTTVKAIVFRNQVLKKISPNILQDGKEVGLVLDRSQLFSEESGHASDFATIVIENETVFDVRRVVNVKGYAIHFGRFRELRSESAIGDGNIGVIKLDEERRVKIMRNHTGLHLLNAGLRNSFIGFAEKFSEVGPEKLRLTFITYKKNVDKITDIEALEKYVSDFIAHGVYVKRRIFSQAEFQRLDDVAFVPGDFILDAEIPVVEINSGFKLSREYCKGAHVLNTSEIKDFVITKHIQEKHSSHSIEAVTGDEAIRIRETDREMSKKWSEIKESISADLTLAQVDELSSRVWSFQSEDLSKRDSSVAVRQKLRNEVEEAKKKLKIVKRALIRSFLTREINKATERSAEKFLVHRLDLRPEFVEELDSVEKSLIKPSMLFVKVDELVTVLCFVPQEYALGDFNAKNWIQSSVTFGGIGYFKKGQDPDLAYFLKERKLSEKQLSESMETAADYAGKNMNGEMVASVEDVRS